MKLLFTAMVTLTFVMGLGLVGLTFVFGKMALAYGKNGPPVSERPAHYP